MWKLKLLFIVFTSLIFAGCSDRNISAKAEYFCRMQGSGYEAGQEIAGVTIISDKSIPLIVGVQGSLRMVSFRMNKLNLDSEQPVAVYIPGQIRPDGTVSTSAVVGYCFIWPKQRRLYLNASIIKRIRLRLAPETELFPDGIESHPLNGWYDFAVDLN